MRWCWSSSPGCGITTTALPAGAAAGRLLRPRSLQPARLDRRGASLSRSRSIPDAAGRARARYACFDHFGDDPQVYGYLTTSGQADPCENEAVGQLVEMQRRAAELAPTRRTRWPPTSSSSPTQNARLARNAESYYRAMFHGRIPSWNLRDRHMAETLDELAAHLEQRAAAAKVVVWAHNSHLGDARATAMVAEGELNLGQLVRERHGARRISHRLHDQQRHGHRGRQLGRAGAATPGSASHPRQPRSPVARGR